MAPPTGKRPDEPHIEASAKGAAKDAERVAQGRVVIPPYHRPLTDCNPALVTSSRPCVCAHLCGTVRSASLLQLPQSSISSWLAVCRKASEICSISPNPVQRERAFCNGYWLHPAHSRPY